MGVWRGMFAMALGAISVAEPASAARILYARGAWAAIARGGVCEASAKALRPARKGEPQARAALAFDARRRGELALQLSRVPRPGSTALLTVGTQPFLLVSRGGWAWSRGPAQEAAIVTAMRVSGGMRIEARDASGRRFVDRYLLEGAPTAIDAAAAGCPR